MLKRISFDIVLINSGNVSGDVDGKIFIVIVSGVDFDSGRFVVVLVLVEVVDRNFGLFFNFVRRLIPVRIRT